MLSKHDKDSLKWKGPITTILLQSFTLKTGTKTGFKGNQTQVVYISFKAKFQVFKNFQLNLQNKSHFVISWNYLGYDTWLTHLSTL